MNPYEVLGVAPTATPEEIRRAWQALARQHHPDHGGDAATMQTINEAWAVLGDARRKAAWDATEAPVAPEPDVGADDDLDVDVYDDRPYVEPARRPLDVAPVALFALAVAIGCLGVALDEPAMLGAALFVFFMSCLAVVATALLVMRRTARSGRR
jgi:hypothetical protein